MILSECKNTTFDRSAENYLIFCVLSWGQLQFAPWRVILHGGRKAISALTVNNTYDESGRLVNLHQADIYHASASESCNMTFLYGANGVSGCVYTYGSLSTIYYFLKNLLGDITEICNAAGTILARYRYNAYGLCTVTELSSTNGFAQKNPFRYRGYIYDTDTGFYYCNARYYNPEFGRWISPDSIEYLAPENIHGLNLYAYCGNDSINFSYSNSSAVGGTSVGGRTINSIGTSNSHVRQANSSSTSKAGLNLGWLTNGLDTGSTIHGLYTSISGLVNHTAYFAKNYAPFADDMTMLGASMKDGVLAFNQFSWEFGKLDAIGIALGVGLDIYDSIQRGVSPGGVLLGATLTAAKGVGLIYLNKGILYGATALGSLICPTAGTVVGFVVGGIVCVFVDIFASSWLDDLIDSVTK